MKVRQEDIARELASSVSLTNKYSHDARNVIDRIQANWGHTFADWFDCHDEFIALLVSWL